MSPENPLIMGHKVKGQGHTPCVGLQTQLDISVAAAYISHTSYPCYNAPPQQCQ